MRYKWGNLDKAWHRLTALGLTKGVLHIYLGRIKIRSSYIYVPRARTRGTGLMLNAASDGGQQASVPPTLAH